MHREYYNLVLGNEIVLPPGFADWGPVIGYIRYASMHDRSHNIALFPKINFIPDPKDPYKKSENEVLFDLVSASIGQTNIHKNENGMYPVYDAGIFSRTTNNQLRLVTELPFGFDIQDVYSESRTYPTSLHQARIRTAMLLSQVFNTPVTVKDTIYGYKSFFVSHVSTPPEFSNQ